MTDLASTRGLEGFRNASHCKVGRCPGLGQRYLVGRLPGQLLLQPWSVNGQGWPQLTIYLKDVTKDVSKDRNGGALSPPENLDTARCPVQGAC